ncbi:hypothetical protein ACFCVY_11060 [Streptomyces sp. NPDC056411]|uniref:hypothetical protein n=1 Tax=Streptomyces sp. NPDC056411 TaxID=3345813 RepID=UPI0035DC9FB8
MAYESSVPSRAGTEGYTSFRIPSVVRARSGAVPAFAEGRVPSAADSGAIDLVLKRSLDGGATWRGAHTVSGLPAGHCDLVRRGRDRVGLRYETGDFSAPSTITFRRIPVEEPT